MTPNTRVALTILAFTALATMLVRGTQDAYAVFLLPIGDDFGWARADVSSVYAVTFGVVGLSGPLVGWLFDRWGPLRTYLTGATLAVGACLLVGQVQALWQFYLVLGLMFGFASACVGMVPMASLLSRWFRQRLNTALAFGLSSYGFGMLLLAPAAQALIDGFGWRLAYVGMGAIVAILLPAMLLVPWRLAAAGHPDYRPQHAAGTTSGIATGITLHEAVRTAAFWGITLAFLFTSVGMFSVTLQTPAYLVSIGYTAQQAAQAYGTLGLLLPVGMIGFGWLGDRTGRRRAVLISYAGTAIGIAALAAMRTGPSLWLLALFVVCFGGTFGSRGPAISTIAATIFRGRNFGRIYGCITVGMGIGGATGAWLGGVLHDLTGDYLVGHIVAIAAIACGAAPFALIRAITRV